MRMFITSKNKYLSNDMKIFGTCSIPLRGICPDQLDLTKAYIYGPLFSLTVNNHIERTVINVKCLIDHFREMTWQFVGT